MITRRDFLNAAAASSAGLALFPFAQQVEARAAGKVPKRFVFVMRANGMLTSMVTPKEIELARVSHKDQGSHHKQGREHDSTSYDKPLSELTLPEPLEALAPFRDRMNLITGLSGRMCLVNHGARYGALGAYRSQRNKAPIAATVDGVLANHIPGIFAHVGLSGGRKKGTVSGLSALGAKRSISYYMNPLEAYNNVFSIISNDKSVRDRTAVRGDVLDFMVGDVSRYRKSLPSHERDKLDGYVGAFEDMSRRHRALVEQRERLVKLAPKADGRYDSEDMELRMMAHWELAASVLITGLTNVVSYRLDSGFSGESFSGTLSKLAVNCHGIGHSSDPKAQLKMLAWQCENLAKFLTKLDNVSEGDGTMLDNTLVVFFSHYSDAHHAGGYEFPMLTLGNVSDAGKPKFRRGRYINYPYYTHKGNRTIGSFYNTILHGAGIHRETFGQLDVNMPDKDQKGPLPELLA